MFDPRRQIYRAPSPYKVDIQRNRASNPEPDSPEFETLPPGHHSPSNTRTIFGTDLAILYRGQMTRKTSKLLWPCENTEDTPTLEFVVRIR
ncbi:hypothetical protein AVEN_185208-1 [Araneus ventricosus]|uniref:Uncharacterized protein n=1 Tax=Araneus ventricosus TaxID=182803 RepID=A0A4Y2S930_ARAVE|nr:hypothetical protein AVEN_185208-1 [Araneus ventricosus]